MNVKVAIELYYTFSKFRNLDTGNLLMTLSIITLLCRLNINLITDFKRNEIKLLPLLSGGKINH